MALRFSIHGLLRKLGILLAVAVPLELVLAMSMYRIAAADPVVRRTAVELPGLAAPVRAVLISDIHVAGPDMLPARLRRIVAQVNALLPDIVLIARSGCRSWARCPPCRLTASVTPAARSTSAGGLSSSAPGSAPAAFRSASAQCRTSG